MAEIVKWGVLSTAQIGLNAVIPAINSSVAGEFYAIASRDSKRAKSSAEKLGAKKWYSSYEELIEDPDVDAIYNPLPPALHAPWTIKAAEKGKHVLCEKPLAPKASEARDMVEQCKAHGVYLMEAFMYRFHPRIAQIFDLIKSGAIGEIEMMRGTHSGFHGDPGDIRFRHELGGGALRDRGIYPVNLARLLMECEPSRVFAFMDFFEDTAKEKYPIDMSTVGILEFPSGARCEFSSRMDAKYEEKWFEIIGSKGRIFANLAFSNLKDEKECFILMNDEKLPSKLENVFVAEVEAMNNAILNGTPYGRFMLDPEDPIKNMQVLDALYCSALTGSAVSLAN